MICTLCTDEASVVIGHKGCRGKKYYCSEHSLEILEALHSMAATGGGLVICTVCGIEIPTTFIEVDDLL